MARSINRLSSRAVATANKPGLLSDGGGLYLRVDPSGAKRWAFIFRWQGKRTEMGLGSIMTLSLAEARQRAREARQLLLEKQNPLERRRQNYATNGLHTFGALADQLIEDLSPQWKNAVHRAQWKKSLQTDAAALRPKSVSSISTDDVLAV